jgi:hypothetical protein
MAKNLNNPLQPLQIQLPNESVDLDPVALDNLIRAHGIQFVHFKALRCPIGLDGLYDSRRSHPDHGGCSNGFLYRKAGIITCTFLNNVKESKSDTTGILESSGSNLTIPRFYDDSGEPVFVAPFDRLYLSQEEILVVHWQLLAYNNTGIDRLKFPAVKVTDLIDSNGVEYCQDREFQLIEGRIKWLGAKRPGWNIEENQGVVFSTRFLYRPYFYISSIPHEIRVVPLTNQNGERVAVPLPKQCRIHREYVFENMESDPEAPFPNDPRQQFTAPDGNTGSR